MNYQRLDVQPNRSRVDDEDWGIVSDYAKPYQNAFNLIWARCLRLRESKGYKKAYEGFKG